MQPNILFINVDQMRADCLSIMGHPVVETPYLDQLARGGVLFDSAYSATPTCVPARAAIMTGMSQTSHGRVGYEDGIPWNYEHTLAGELADASYHTQCVGKMHVYPTRNLCGFHNVVLHDGYMHYNRYKQTTPAGESFEAVDDYLAWLRNKVGADLDLLDMGLDCNSSVTARPWQLPEKYHPTNWVVSESIDFLRRRDPTKPFFLKMSFVRPHPPFDPPQTFFDQYINETLPDPVVGEWARDDDPYLAGLDPLTDHGLVPPKRLKRARAAYYALISHIDNQIGRFLLALHEYGELENTVILFASDHGEMLGDHHRFAKSLPYEGSTAVPFIVSDPGNRLGLARGSRVSEPVEMRDIMPTLLDAAGASIPETVDGQSVLPLARGKKIDWRAHIHGEHALGEESHHFVTNGKEKFIWFSQTGDEQFFDLQLDPGEKQNLINDPDHQTAIQAWREKLIDALKGREEGYTDGKILLVGKQPQTVLSHILPEDDADGKRQSE
ncbi:Arylsulfatase [Lentibacillus sp. JNUCC-1]|uniref:arylsulfatase n=1 Tax=Lentibacillus sp. JNUCC-1 TaxID=2654513 RepID=UPI0012E83A84|nr:arylsulfatase [Lentibacillus sp. JNUCC-1]MUV36889.1 Arylsulfatase [Lentibacillus sp. JNUCC-1]